MPEAQGEKRPLDPDPDDDDDDDDDGFGPMPVPAPAQTKPKRKKVLKNAHVYLDNLPKSEMYEKSFMHRDVVHLAVCSNATGFLVTGSEDGHVKFWKKQYEGIEFVKHYRAHLGKLLAMVISQDGRLLSTIGDDNALKLFEVTSFDMICMIKLKFKPLQVEFVHKKNAPTSLVAVSESESGKVHILQPESGTAEPLRTLEVHAEPAHAIRYNPWVHACISADKSGALELWDPDTLQMPTKETRPGRLKFEIKSETHMYELRKNQTHTSLRNASKMKRFAAAALFAVTIQASEDAERTRILSEIQELRGQLQKQRVIIQQQFTQLANLEEDEERRLQAVGNVTATAWATEKAALEATDGSMGAAMDTLWLCLCGALVMFMHAGFAMLETGCCRSKNASNVLMKNLVNVCVGTLGWWVLGYAFAYGGGINRFIGTTNFLGEGFYTKDASGNILAPGCANNACQSTALAWFFQWAFCTAGATIVSGAVAERVQGPTYASYAFVMTSLIYPVVVHWGWSGSGFLGDILDVGVMDFAGSGIVHLTGGVSGLAGTIVLGPRKGRFVNPEEFEPHNLPLVVFGTFALWFGWYGFNPGSTLGMSDGATGALAAQVAMNTTIAAATGGITVFLLRYIILRKYDVGGLCNGILAGLVSITAPCGNIECGSAFAVGFIGALVYQGSSMLLQKLKIDDPVDASPVHGFCGIWGVLAAGLFDWGKGFDHFHGWSGWGCMTDDSGACQTGINGSALGAQVILILMVIAWAGTISALTFALLKWWGALRISEDTEDMGLDAKAHSPPKAYAFSA
ncbi:amtB [Symbiodinium microadriaticum]|nr:amtB [Symbiodinium sp. KB8]CAE7219025.1 amtB [Symbiodinium microadriaticum]